MHVLSQSEFLVALLSGVSAAVFIVVAMSRASNPIGDEMAQSIRESVVLLDSCAHTIDGEPMGGSMFAGLSAERSPTPARRLHPSPPSFEPGAATRT